MYRNPVQKGETMEEEKVVEGENRNVRKSMKKASISKESDIYMQLFNQEEMPEEYIKVVAKEERIPVLKQLFLCAIEEVPIEKVEIALLKDPPDESLKQVRQKYSKTKEIRDISDEVHSIKEMITNFQKEQKKLLKMVASIKEDTGVFDAMFPEEQVIQGEHLVKEKIKKPLPQKEEMQEKSEVEETSGEVEIGEGKIKTKIGSFMEKNFSTEKSITHYIESLYKDGYKTEQVNFILDCLEEGIKVKDLKKMFNPVFPIETMEKLKNKYLKEMQKDGK